MAGRLEGVERLVEAYREDSKGFQTEICADQEKFRQGVRTDQEGFRQEVEARLARTGRRQSAVGLYRLAAARSVAGAPARRPLCASARGVGGT